MKVCENCFEDDELKGFISSNSLEKCTCEYCDTQDAEFINFNELADFFTGFLGLFKSDKNGKPLYLIIREDWKLFSKKVDKKLLNDILNEIKIDVKSHNQNVKYISNVYRSSSYWEQLKETIKWKSRFLTNIDQIKELHWDLFFEDAKINVDSTSKFYRARMHGNGQEETFDTKEMGHPLSRSKVSEGRANPQGIPFLYLSQSIKTTLYETRASYLDEISVGTFTIKDGVDLNLIDFTNVPSAFALNEQDSPLEDLVAGILLKKRISKELSKPLRRHDSNIEYIPTQFICEYIRYITGSDGIIFESSLHIGGINIVLFDQNKVECKNVESVVVSEVIIKY